MPFQIIRNDITRVVADAIVNTANPLPTYADGTDRAIYEAAGAEQLLAVRKKIGNILPGEVAVTPAFRLQAKHIIHTVGPVWQGGTVGEAETLRRCYENVLAKAAELQCEEVALPLISTGCFGFPRDKALEIAIGVISPFLMEHEMTVTLVVFDRSSVVLSEKLFHRIDAFIDSAYVDQKQKQEYLDSRGTIGTRSAYASHPIDAPRFSRAAPPPMPQASLRRAPERSLLPRRAIVRPKPESTPPALEDMLKQTDLGFQKHLFLLMDERKLSAPQVYKATNLTKQFFSKLLSNPDYIPGKYTIVALCLAMELNFRETQALLYEAGYTLTHSSIPDLILEFCIRNRQFNVVSVNLLLFEKGFSGLNEGCKRLT